MPREAVLCGTGLGNITTVGSRPTEDLISEHRSMTRFMFNILSYYYGASQCKEICILNQCVCAADSDTLLSLHMLHSFFFLSPSYSTFLQKSALHYPV